MICPLYPSKQIGYLPETPPLYSDMTVRDFLGFFAKIKEGSAGDRQKKKSKDYQIKVP